MADQKPLLIYLMPWGRVGSNLVNDIFLTAGGVKLHNEPLTALDTGGRSKAEVRNIWARQAEWLEDKILNTKYDKPVFLNLAAFHILDPIKFSKLMAPCDAVYVIQDRKDVVATVISSMRTSAWVEEGKAKGEVREWSIPKGQSVHFRPNISGEDFLKMVGVIEKGRENIGIITEDRNVTTYFYEDLVEDMDGVVTDIFSKARIPYRPYEVFSSKFGSQMLWKMISNPEEISKIVRDHKVPTSLVLTT